MHTSIPASQPAVPLRTWWWWCLRAYAACICIAQMRACDATRRDDATTRQARRTLATRRRWLGTRSVSSLRVSRHSKLVVRVPSVRRTALQKPFACVRPPRPFALTLHPVGVGCVARTISAIVSVLWTCVRVCVCICPCVSVFCGAIVRVINPPVCGGARRRRRRPVPFCHNYSQAYLCNRPERCAEIWFDCCCSTRKYTERHSVFSAVARAMRGALL